MLLSSESQYFNWPIITTIIAVVVLLNVLLHTYITVITINFEFSSEFIVIGGT